MKRRFPGLSQAALPVAEVPDGLYLVRVERVQYRWDKQKPYYAVRFAVLEPKQFAGTSLPGRLYCTDKALWKLSWFLRDFGYDTELLGRDELDEKRLVGLQGVLKVSHTTIHGRTYLNLDAFAPAGEWDEFMAIPPASEPMGAEPEVA
ncbi:MAG TPA: hypothetical protein VF840_07015 [Terriglobales bacterium]